MSCILEIKRFIIILEVLPLGENSNEKAILRAKHKKDGVIAKHLNYF